MNNLETETETGTRPNEMRGAGERVGDSPKTLSLPFMSSPSFQTPRSQTYVGGPGRGACHSGAAAAPHGCRALATNLQSGPGLRRKTCVWRLPRSTSAPGPSRGRAPFSAAIADLQPSRLCHNASGNEAITCGADNISYARHVHKCKAVLLQ